MCTLCYELAGDEHWTDVPVASGAQTPARHRRARILSRVLAHYGLAYADSGPGGPASVSDRKGSVELVGNVAAVWPAVERLAGRHPDPLDPGLLEALDELSEDR
ncbi:MAG: hypothetical protein GEV03_14735 [Streptosporangiales bacterium]|nr:hypothetical protein [Streptosporangiales bacterium]